MPNMATQAGRVRPEMLMESVAVELGTGVDSKDIEITEFSSEKACSDGDNFAADVNRVNLVYRKLPEGDANEVEGAATTSWSLISKALPSDEKSFKYLTCKTLFRTEIVFFNKVLPALRKIKMEFGQKNPRMPKCCFSSEPEGILILEDLKRQGFRNVSRSNKGLPDGHVECALVQLARLHATTYHFLQSEEGKAILEEVPELSKKDPFMECFPPEFAAPMFEYFRMIHQNSIEALAALDESLAQRMAACMPTLMEKNAACLEARSPSSLSVLVHGDFWFNNIMFRGGGEDPLEMAMIDMQMVRLGSPVWDLLYFFESSTSREARKENLGRWLGLYHQTLMKDLCEEYGYPQTLYPLDELLQDYDHAFFWGYCSGVNHAQVLIMDMEKLAALMVSHLDEFGEKVVELGGTVKKDSPEFGQIIKDLAEEAAERGKI